MAVDLDYHVQLSQVTNFRNSLQIPNDQRTAVDIHLIYRHLREMQATTSLPEATLRTMAESARYEEHESNELLYTAEDPSTSWYILLSGSIYLDCCMYLPGSSFGKQALSGKRGSDCLILEKSEMIVIDYPNQQLLKPCVRRSYTSRDLEQLLALDDNVDDTITNRLATKDIEDENIPSELRDVKEIVKKSEAYLENIGREDKDQRGYSRHGIYGGEEQDLDLSGLKETMVDSDSADEDSTSTSSESAAVRDIVRDCLEKDPSERTETDINILMDFMQHLPAFNNVTHNVRHEMCKVMVFAVVDKADSIVMDDKEEMDSWSVILNGSVEVVEVGKQPYTMHLGDSFGVKKTSEIISHKGVMRTRVDDCQFVCIEKTEYWRIFSQGEANTKKVEEEGEVVMVTEHRTTDGGSREGQVVIRGIPNRLLDHLMEDHSMIDPTYVEDYLLTYVVFHNKPHELASKLLKWFERGGLKDKVTRVMLIWVNNHYNDFEGDSFMESILERFECLLEARKMLGQLRLLNMACSQKSKPRIITLERPSRESRLDFGITSGKERGHGIFVQRVDFDSKAYDAGLKKGDQILEVNGQAFENITGNKAMETLMMHAHLCMTVKKNIIGFKEIKGRKEQSFRNEPRLLNKRQPIISRSSSDCDGSERKAYLMRRNLKDVHSGIPNKMTPEQVHDPKLNHLTFPGGQLKQNAKLKKIMRLNILPRAQSDNNIANDHRTNMSKNLTKSTFELNSKTWSHHGSTDAINQQMDMLESNCQVIRVYRQEQNFKHFVIGKETTAQEVLIMAVEMFGITDSSGKPYFLCEVTVTEDGVIKQKRLPSIAINLANRIGLSARYYMKNSLSNGGGIPDEVAQEIAREGSLSLLQLSPLEIAKELTLQDFELFRNIDSREYIYNLFESKVEGKWLNMKVFEKTNNIEMFWIIKEVCIESNIQKRTKFIKRFIKVAKLCKDFKNYNSLFAILSGLDHSSVRRLKNTWEKVPAKHVKMFEDLKTLMDPSRNMCNYRNLFNGEKAYPPLIPFFPIVKKDLTFLHLGNDTYVDNLINFEKLRMIAREVRKVCKYCAIGYDPNKMDDLSSTHVGSAPPSIAQSVVSVMTGQNSLARRNRRTSGGLSNPRKMYDEFIFGRRIRQYMENLSRNEYTEAELYNLSLQQEPREGAVPSSGQMRRKTPPITLSPVISPIGKKKGKLQDQLRSTSPSKYRSISDALSTTSSSSTPSTSPSPSLRASKDDIISSSDERETRDSLLDPHSPRRRTFNVEKRADSQSSSTSSPLGSVLSTTSLDTGYQTSGSAVVYTQYPEFIEDPEYNDVEGQISIV